jgi:DNA adenine methylase Dam
MYVNGYLNYTGSKFKLLNQIIPNLDTTKKYFIDLFTGSFVVAANVANLYEQILANDIIPELIQIHQQLLENNTIIEKTKSICPNTKEEFLNLRNSFNENKSPEKLWALILSCTNNLMRFNKKFQFNQTYGERKWNQNTDKKVSEFVNNTKQYKNKFILTSKHFNEIQITKPSMIYIDPPYSETEAGYNAYWNKEDDILLYNYCNNINKINSSFMVSGILGEHKNNKRSILIDKLIQDGYNYKLLEHNYEKVARIKNNKNSQEIIITNYKIKL